MPDEPVILCCLGSRDATYNDASSFLNTLKSDSEENVGHWKMRSMTPY